MAMTESMTVFFPPDFDQQVIKVAQSMGIIDFSCVSIHLTRAPPYCSMCLTSNISSITVRIGEVVLPLGHTVPLENVIIELKLLDSNASSGGGWRHDLDQSRFALTGGDTNETEMMMNECAYYINGVMNTTGCVTGNESIGFINCTCAHFSNFGVLMFGGSLSSKVDDWTTFRIISLSLTLAIWAFLALFFVTFTLSYDLRAFFGLLTHTEKADAVLPPRTSSSV